MPINPHIFREYDIRGRVDEDLGDDAVFAIGRAYGTYVIKNGLKEVACGRDGRAHSAHIQKILIEGITSAGINVIDVGQCPTPLLYFAIFHLKTDGGIQVTGSHNPPEFNGFKMCLGTSTLYGRRILELEEIIEKGAYSHGKGAVRSYDISGPYLDYMKENIHISHRLKVVLDAGNGVAGLVAPRAFEDQGCDVIPLFCDVDGLFPNHHPDPTVPANLAALRDKVLETGADAGMAYDGDGDRLGVVDEKGDIVFADRLMVIFAREVLKNHPGAAIIGEVKCSHILYEEIEKAGGRAIMWKTGHSLIKKKMADEGALLAGEMSGHIFFADRYFGYDDGVYASLRLAEIMASDERPLSYLFKDLPEIYSTPEIRIECPDERKFAIVERAKGWFSARFKTIDIDGVRVIFDDGWGLIRASNTQPVLVLRFEASSEKRLGEIRNLMENRLKEIVGGQK
ncbi:MAG: phosphomannomutase/phosphoglucomutase [Dissulfurimicrobium sp.]|uniref:phosphomannomutase/phosphoglucomutase n=1 Tax=Dissulfurimicrobium TaxID=1769732 RepID=UPI001EDA93B1|nr:phosphomannomutase/phosphoglucomutase [Dissulfurimicrobium hydrothermale]UKL13858.1 phosphomannomutase/phosphoglucomutase [Dissulfurimicrobium hydrothermale]